MPTVNVRPSALQAGQTAIQPARQVDQDTSARRSRILATVTAALGEFYKRVE